MESRDLYDSNINLTLKKSSVKLLFFNYLTYLPA